MADCPHLIDVHRYHDSELPAAQTQALLVHLRQCPQCRSELATLGQLRSMLRSARQPEMSAQTRQAMLHRLQREPDRIIYRWAGSLMAAAAMILLACLLQWSFDNADGSRTSTGANAGTVAAGGPVTWEILATRSGSDISGVESEEMLLARWVASDLTAELADSSNRTWR